MRSNLQVLLIGFLSSRAFDDSKHLVDAFRAGLQTVGYIEGQNVADSVAEGVIPQDQANDLFICVGVFIHWDAAHNKKIQDYNYRATKEAIARAIGGDPKAAEVIAKRNIVKHPFAA